MSPRLKTKVTDEQWAAVESRLGVVPDTTLAVELGVDPSTVFHHRRRLGIDPLRKVTDKQWDSVLDRLGVEPDERIGTELGVTREAVRLKRKALGIPRRIRTKERVGASGLLGTLVDSEVADLLGTTTATVFQVRAELGISSYREQHPPQHGTRNMYQHHKCRCDDCRFENARHQTLRYHQLNPNARRYPTKYVGEDAIDVPGKPLEDDLGEQRSLAKTLDRQSEAP